MFKKRQRSRRFSALVVLAVAATTLGSIAVAFAATGLKSGQTVYFIPKDTLNPYEVIADKGGAIALKEIGNKQVVSSGTADTAAAQIPSIQAAIQSGANAIVIAGNDPKALCPYLNQARAKGIAVVSFDSDVTCRQLFINQADTETIGRSQVALIGKEMGYKGELAILSAASTATNQNAWIKWMKVELKKAKYKNMKLVKIYYGNDNPAQSLQATQSMLQAYPNLKGIISPTTVGISTAAQYLSNSKYKGKIILTGLGLPSQMKKYVLDGTVKEFALWNPSDLGYLAAYAASSFSSGVLKGKVGEKFKAGKLGTYTIIKAEGGPQVILGPPFVFNKSGGPPPRRRDTQPHVANLLSAQRASRGHCGVQRAPRCGLAGDARGAQRSGLAGLLAVHLRDRDGDRLRHV
jgi:rhamnose transport system substrate-binding protein